MNKKIILSIIIVFIATLFITIKIIIPNIIKSKELELTYTINGGVPYKWEYEIEDDSIVEFVGTKDITSDKDKKLLGGPVYINYIFKGLKKGKTTIIFKYVSIIDGSIEKEDKITVKVDNYKNISLVAIP